MQGKKTHEQFERQLEKKPDVPKEGDVDKHPEQSHSRAPRDRDARQSELPISEHGMNQEDRQHNDKRRASSAVFRSLTSP